LSTDDEWCEFNDMPKASCDHCRNQGKAPRDEYPTEMGKVFVAKYRGTCYMDCGEPIVYGDHIAAVEVVDGQTKYAHYGCMRA
jgi:hypothetical protein